MAANSQALEAAVSQEAAAPLFEQAAAKFQEVAALALLNWGNVHMCQARRLFDTTTDKEQPVAISPEVRPTRLLREVLTAVGLY
eukprot:1570403-Pyramimonas_sp.AAC.1